MYTLPPKKEKKERKIKNMVVNEAVDVLELCLQSTKPETYCGVSTPTVKYGGGGIFFGNSTTYVWASGIVLVDGGQAGSYLQLLLVRSLICRLK